MPCKGHHIVLTHAVGKPHAYGCPPDIMESAHLDARPSEDLIEAPLEIIYYLEPGVRKGPPAFRSEHILDVIVPCRGNKNIRIAFRLSGLVIRKHLDDFLCQWQSPSVGIFDKLFPGIFGILFGIDFEGLRIEVDICPGTVQKLRSSHGSCHGYRNYQIPFDRFLRQRSPHQ